VHWSALGAAVDDAVVGIGIGFLIYRQFRWRDADPGTILRLPLIIVACGVAAVVVDVLRGERLTAMDLTASVGELVLVSATGTVMGFATRFRGTHGSWQYKLSGWGIALWAAFLAIRIGSLVLASRLSAPLLETTGAIVVSFGVNRVASRTPRPITTGATCSCSSSTNPAANVCWATRTPPAISTSRPPAAALACSTTASIPSVTKV